MSGGATAERDAVLMPTQRPAVFLDRDGVLTEPVWNPQTGAFESPHAVNELRMCANVLEPLRHLLGLGFDLFIVSNQPSYAKGKTSLTALHAIARQVDAYFRAAGIAFRESYYCYHHPQGIVDGFSGPCPCRKPSPAFLLQAAEQHAIDLACSWMIGDRDTDIACGERAGCRTILILHPHAGDHQGRTRPDGHATDLAGAVRHISAELAAQEQHARQQGGAPGTPM
jgi:D-glycero-D-manno-heptose 1,7-bisphosphate phosphatase